MSTTTVTGRRISDTEYVMERTFAATPQRVFEAYTTAEQIAAWWCQRATTTLVEALDVRPGGVWRFVQHDAYGSAYEFHG
ncbi:MAG: SRPBCC domain-containing protein, partial [Thermomicrobiales bacterium]|nr:SRPBCC domain-containing protein [Thermomicrobiales bacterium]